MANRKDPAARSIRGTNPQNLVEKIVRAKIYQNIYWKEQCFGLTAETLVDKAMELDHLGGTFGGNRKPTPFISIVLKMLQIQPEKDIVVEFIKNDDYKVIDELLTKDYSCDIALPRIKKRWNLDAICSLPPRKSALEDDFEEEEKDEDYLVGSDAGEDEKHYYRAQSPIKERDSDRRRDSYRYRTETMTEIMIEIEIMKENMEEAVIGRGIETGTEIGIGTGTEIGIGTDIA